MFEIKSWEMFFVFAILIYGFEVFSRQNNDYIKAMIVSFIIANVINLETVVGSFSNHFIEVIIFEVVVAAITFIVMKISQAFSTMNLKFVLFIIEIILALGLCFVYYYTGSFLYNYIH